jgi:hypothetical protein
MCREICLGLAVALLLGGCVRKSPPPKTPPAKVQKAPAKSVPARAPKAPEPAVAPKPAVAALSATEARDPVAVARWFLTALTGGKYNQAAALCTPDKLTARGLAQMSLAFQMDQATVAQVWAGSRQAVAVTNLVPLKQGPLTGALWALQLVTADEGHWRIRAIDYFPDAPTADKYLATFREAEPDAKPLQP